MIRVAALSALALFVPALGGCAVVAVADAGVGVAAATVKTTAKVAGATAGLAVDGVSAVGRAATGARKAR